MEYADYDTLRALDSDNAPAVPSMSDEEINSLPVHKYKIIGAQRLVLQILFPCFCRSVICYCRVWFLLLDEFFSLTRTSYWG